MDKEEAIRRLIFIRYLYNYSVEQSKKQQPFSWLSLLIFHDTVELFLVLAAEFLGQTEKALRDLSFKKYWGVIDPLLKGKSGLTQRISMERLNDARNAYKHHGTTPSEDTINSARINVGNFLEENSQIVFEVDFLSISLIDFVVFIDAKNNLNKAIDHIKNNEKEEAMDMIALSFWQLIDDYIDRKRDWYGHSVFSFSRFNGFSSSEDMLSDVESAFDEVESALDGIEEPLRLLALGLDYRKYVRFDLLTSRRIRNKGSDGYKITRLERKIDCKLDDENMQFCIDYVIECALILKRCDFELIPKKQPDFSDLF